MLYSSRCPQPSHRRATPWLNQNGFRTFASPRRCRWKRGRSRCGGSSPQEQKFRVKNIGAEPIFSEFHVTNPQSGKTYRVAIRGERLGDNYCSCPDFATNTLGTCKHVEFTLARLRRRRGAKAAMAAGFQPPYSEVYLRYGAKREVIFGPGAACPAALKTLAAEYFDGHGILRPEAYGRFHVFLKTAMGGHHEVRCYDDALAFIAQVRDRADLDRRIAKAFPDGAAGRAGPPPEGPAVSFSGGGRPVCRAGRPVPDRRRHGPGQDDPGHRRRRDSGPRRRRRAGAGRSRPRR